MVQEKFIPIHIHLIGAGGLTRDFYSCFKDEVIIDGIWDDGVPKGTDVKGIKVTGTVQELIDSDKPVKCVIMVANPLLRKKFSILLEKSAHTCPVIVHSLARIYSLESVEIGNGTIIFPYTIITTEVTVGAHTLIHANCSLHHDSSVGNHSVLMPGSRLTGNVTVGNEVYIGANVALSNGMKVEDGMRVEK